MIKVDRTLTTDVLAQVYWTLELSLDAGVTWLQQPKGAGATTLDSTRSGASLIGFGNLPDPESATRRVRGTVTFQGRTIRTKLTVEAR